MIRPIPEGKGVGFCSMEQKPEFSSIYKEEQVGRYWNYYVTPENCSWPEETFLPDQFKYRIDGFSPNLNKSLHIGHLRQLILANSISKITQCAPVALLGASQGCYQFALNELYEWFNFCDYHPTVYYDVLMPRDYDVVPRYKKMMPTESGESEVEVFDGPKGPVIVTRNDGRPTYAFHDVAFAKTVNPTHYITGAEQKEHFESLGLGDKHLPMGLVLGADNKKIKSRTGDSVTAKEVLEEIKGNLSETPQPDKLVWNVLAWNFLRVSRSKNVKYTPQEWTKVDSGGMYITYTYARIASTNIEEIVRYFTPAVLREITQDDANLIGFASQYNYYLKNSIEDFDPAQLANFTFELAKKLNLAYGKEKIKDGRVGFQLAVHVAFKKLELCMTYLGMFKLTKV